MNTHPTIMVKIKTEEDRQRLIDAGIITVYQKDPWVFLENHKKYKWDASLRSHTCTSTWSVTLQPSYRISCLRVSVKQFIALCSLAHIMPDMSIDSIVPIVERSQRNRYLIAYHYGASHLLSEKYR